MNHIQKIQHNMKTIKTCKFIKLLVNLYYLTSKDT